MSSPETYTRADDPVNPLLRDGEVRFGPVEVGAFRVPSFRRRPSVAIREPLLSWIPDKSDRRPTPEAYAAPGWWPR